MPIYDRRCLSCGQIKPDCFEPLSAPDPQCGCGGVLQRVLLPGRLHHVAPDSIPGGMLVKHGICNPDGTPRRYDSYSEMRRVAKEMGLQNVVRHAPLPGTDKSKHTQQWVAAPVITEEERTARWWEHEAHMRGLTVEETKNLLTAPVYESGVRLGLEGDRLTRIIGDCVQQSGINS